MHIFFQKIWAFISAMSIEYSEIAAAWPSSFEVGFGDVHDDWYSIFVIVFNEAMKSIDCIAFYCAIGLLDEFDWLYFRNCYDSSLLVLVHDCKFLTIIIQISRD